MKSTRLTRSEGISPAGLMICLVLATLLSSWGCSQGEKASDGSSLAPQQLEDIDITPEMMAASDTIFDPEVTDGATLFLSYCAKCHGLTGLGNGPSAGSLSTQTGMNLAILGPKTDAELYESISSGKGVEMPPWSLVLTQDQRLSLLAYVRTLSAS